ncbi:MAG: hypothetical protein HY083_08910, partial [Gammaproteobacteria bacterium]|nr:hypothetical protein [Gammaproteobacteria bacterium]
GDAVIGVLQVEADHVRKTKIKIDETPAKTADDAKDGGGRATQGAVADAAPDKPDLSPLFWGD